MREALRKARPLAIAYSQKLSGKWSDVTCQTGIRFLIRWGEENFAHLCGLRFRSPRFVRTWHGPGRTRDAALLLELLSSRYFDTLNEREINLIAEGLSYSDNRGYFKDKTSVLPTFLTDPTRLTMVVFTENCEMVLFIGETSFRIGLSTNGTIMKDGVPLEEYFPRSFRLGSPEREAYRNRRTPPLLVTSSPVITLHD